MPVISWASRPALPCPTAKFARTGDVERKKFYAPLFQPLTSIRPCQATRKIRPCLLQCKRKVVRESTWVAAHGPIEACVRKPGTTKSAATKVRTAKAGTTKVRTTRVPTWTTRVAAPGVARVSRRAVSPFVATCLCSMSLQHGQPRRRRCRPSRSGGVNTHESNEIAPAMSGVLTRVRPAPSTQTIENKRTILRHRPRNPRKTEISPYMRHSATFCDIS